MKKVFEEQFRGRILRIEVGELAKQADGACLIRYGDTAVLTTAVASKNPKDSDFFPLTIGYEEKQYAVGKIPGSFLRREGRPSEHATLTARLIDRPIRPMFAEGFRNEVQVVNTVLSVDLNNTPEMSAMFGSSLALSISNIPFDGPIAGVHVGRVNGQFIINPTIEETELSDLHLTVAGTKEAINMVEAGAKEISEEEMLEALMFGHEAIKELCLIQDKIIKEVGVSKREIELYQVDEEIKKDVLHKSEQRLIKAISIFDKLERQNAIDDIQQEVLDEYEAKPYVNEKETKLTLRMVKDVLEGVVEKEVRRLITVDKVRPDGRGVKEIRPLDAQVDLLARAHGSGLFTRGQTQVLSVTTLGALKDEQIIDNLTVEDTRRFIHHYNFPPYSVGEVGRMGSPGRREIGHGALAERALSYVIPTEEEFPYTIRVVSEVLESNGSSSQASICASCMSLMAAGVPIKNLVSGIAMGLVSSGPLDGKHAYTILTDIQGLEDHFGDMDFKVAGTDLGITALQMDIKIRGITKEVLKEALNEAKGARKVIREAMLQAISEPRLEVSKYAPKLDKMQIDIDKIRDVIGSGGKVINDIIAKCDDIKIDINDDGFIVLYHMDRKVINKAKQMIEDIVRVAKVGEVFEGTVTRIEDYGCFVHLFGNVDGLCHVSRLAWRYVEKASDVVKLNQKLKVVVSEIDNFGKVKVSHREFLEKPADYVERPERGGHPRQGSKKPFRK
ncbi:MAG: polyribonucleotide nucleotidyltransferase [Bacilli bacterium]|jgi:polyribonucleotide nucleotidyltransferase|nr:polyribonucleotide nucleotidyltransferase [Erysipelotrichia bacterium]